MTSHSFENLTRGEEELLRATKAGEIAFLQDFSKEQRCVRSEIIRWLCENSSDRNVVAAGGVRLNGAKIVGGVDLDNLEIFTPLWLNSCEIESINLRARTREILLNNSKIALGVFAQGARVDGNWFMRGAVVEGIFNFAGTVLEGQFSANNATFKVADGNAINAQGVRAMGWFMDGAEVEGVFNFTSAVLEGQFSANNATFKVADGKVINAQGVRVSDWFMHGAEVEGIFEINGAVLEGQFSANNATFKVADGKVINAQGVRVSDWFMHGAEVEGIFEISSAVLEGQFSANNATFKVVDGKAINAQRVKAYGWFLRNGCKIYGGIDLYFTVINMIDFADSIVHSQDEIAINLGVAQCDNVTTRSGFSAIGALVCDGAKISSVLKLASARLLAHAHDAPSAVMPHLDFADKVISAVEAEFGRLELPANSDLENGPNLVGIIDLSRAKIGTLVDFESGWYAPLSRWRWFGWWRKNLTEHDGGGMRHIVLDGTSYDYLDNPGGKRANPKTPIWENRVRWLRSQSADALITRFNPQPWRQLGKTLSAMGYEEDARHIAVQRRVAQRVDESSFHRSISMSLHLLANYGFSPWRTVGWCAAFIGAFGGLYGIASGCWWYCVVENNGLAFGEFIATLAGDVLTDDQQIYPAFDPWLYSLDQFIPILDLGMDGFWRPSGFWSYWLSVFEQIFGALMVALVITGFTGLLGRDQTE